MINKIWVPLLKALITGLLCALFSVSIYRLKLYGPTAWGLFWIMFLGVGLFIWLAYIWPRAEMISKVIDSRMFDKTTKIQVVAKDPSGAYMDGKFINLRISNRQMNLVATKYLACGHFSHASMAGPGKPLTRAEFEALRDEFIYRGLAYWVNENHHNLGARLTLAGQAVMKGMASTGARHTYTDIHSP